MGTLVRERGKRCSWHAFPGLQLTCCIAQAEWPRAIEELVSFPHIEEAAILSTCNRMELYVVALSYHRVGVS